jgi:NTP pyrophosphatase (non-canonical NTP hydrolase)
MITQEDIDHFADMQSPIMDMGYYQQEAVKTAIYKDSIIYPALGLGNEAGEVQGKIKKMLRDGTFDKDAIAAEIGDVLWYIAALCRDLEIDMAEVAVKNLAKLKSRQERGTLQGSGDTR